MKRIMFGIVLGVLGMAWLTGCQSESPVSANGVTVEAAALAGYEHGVGCWILVWCSHCNGGAGAFIRQTIPCDDLRDAYLNSEGEWVVPNDILKEY